MKRYYCWNCERQFDEPRIKRTTQARMFGVADFYNDESIEEKLCPYCGSEEIEHETLRD